MKKMPVIFVGHGSPMNAIEDNTFSRTWKTIANSFDKPKAIICISAHWLTEGTATTNSKFPKTIYDFYGFPKSLYEIKYNAPGSTEISKLIKETIKSTKVSFDNEWGLDHGTWSVLVHMYPKADIPVVQLSINSNLPLKEHYKIGQELAKLRNQGILIIGSGNIVHNLMNMDPSTKEYPWAFSFDKYIKENISNHEKIINYQTNEASSYALPTNEHFIPLLYVLGASENGKAKFFNEEIVLGSISMRGVIYY